MNSPSTAPHAAAAPKVSVLMTVYNGEAFLRPAIESLLAQSFDEFELVLVENGCTDASPAIAASFDDPRIRMLHIEHTGRTEALNIGLRAARGRLVAVQDADDMSVPERLARQVQVLDGDPDLVLVASGWHAMDENGATGAVQTLPRTHAELVDALAVANPIAHSGVMYRRSDALAVGGYPVEYPYAQDFALYLTLARRGRLAAVPETLVGIRRHAGQASISPTLAAARAHDGARLHRLARELPGVSRRAWRAASATIAGADLARAYASFVQGRRLHAVGIAVWAFVRSPATALASDEFREITALSRLVPVWRSARRAIGR